MKQQWTIRVINPVPYGPTRRIGHVGLPGVWVEQLRRLGVLKVLREYDGFHAKTEKGDYVDGAEVLEIRCPDARGLDLRMWAESNAARMRSFGINAVAAPEWGNQPFNARG